jgi:hypothetical protein
MLAKIDTQRLDLGSTKSASQRAQSMMTRTVWLPELLYDSLPYFYLTAGFAAFFATLYISDWFWILPHYLIVSAACLHLAFAVFRRRHKTSLTPNEDEVALTGQNPG